MSIRSKVQEQVVKISDGLNQTTTKWAFKLFRDRKFRKLAELDRLSQKEQDRIFNELVVSAQVLIMQTLEAQDLRVPEESKDFLSKVKEDIPNAHTRLLKEYGVERKHRRLWRKLVKMRYREYEKDWPKAREAAMQLESRKGSITQEDLENIHMLLPVQTVAISCHTHILRGKTKGKDEFFKLIVKSLGKFYVEIRVPLEGGKLTIWNKLLVTMKMLHAKLS